MILHLADEQATLYLGKLLAGFCPMEPVTIHLEGELGTGKTTLTRGLLNAFGYQGKVKSPTYTLVEHYPLAKRTIFHFDLYRLSDPEELDYIGLDDYLSHDALCIIEWASKGERVLPEPDLRITLSYDVHARRAELTPVTDSGHVICNALEKLDF